MANITNKEKQALVIRCLVEGMSVNSTVRTTGVSKPTILKLLNDVGYVANRFQNRVLRGLTCKRIEVDEVWTFIYAKERNVPKATNPPPEAGDVWLWTALCPDTKLMASWKLGDRTLSTARVFMRDLAERLAGRVQITSDGHRPYVDAVSESFGDKVDFAMLKKIYEREQLDILAEKISGYPNVDHISTSGVERQNLTLRMSARRYTRRTNAFSKKLHNHSCALALHYLHYNFCRIHSSIKVTPAMRAGLMNVPMNIGWILELVEQARPKPKRPAQYRPRVAA